MSDPNDYVIGWICAIATEYVAARELLDEKHDDPQSVSPHDNNSYTLGRMGKHNVVIAVLPDGEYGTASAANVARDMLHSFPNVRIGLMVGIGGGAPSEKHDIRLGDVVVSAPRNGHCGVFQYDFGKTLQAQKFQVTQFLNQPPAVLRTAVSDLKARYKADGHCIEDTIQTVLGNKKRLRREYQRPDTSKDRLYRAEVAHPRNDDRACATACADDPSSLITRPVRDEEDDNPAIHYGLIASANRMMKDAVVRDRLSEEKEVLCFEMEAAGLMNHFPCLVIRGICDYADSHKNKEWQGYAAMAAAAYAKDLLSRVHPTKVEAEKRICDLISDVAQGIQDTKAIAIETNDGVRGIISKQRQDDVHIWLSPPDPSTNVNRALQLRHTDSGQWFLRSGEYSSWRTEPNSFLWLNGKPGCGKTILSSTIIEDLQKSGSHTQTLLYFYFDFNDAAKQSLESMVRSLIYQLYCHTPGVQNPLDSLYSTCTSGKSQPRTDSLCATFQHMMDLAGEVRIILDALDESL
ncbi:hypothetical protein ACHAQF_008840 [Verticillium nonalfalfae]